MTDNPWDHPDFVAWAARVRNGMFPKMESSAVNIALLPSGDPDVKLAVEIGYGIMLDKPLIVVVAHDVAVSKSWRWWPTRSSRSTWTTSRPRPRRSRPPSPG